MFVARLVLRQPVPAQAALAADRAGDRRRDRVVRPAAHRGRRLVRRREREFVRAARHAQRGVAGLPAAADLRVADPPGAGRHGRVLGELVRRHLPDRAQLLPAVRDRPAELPRDVRRSSCSTTRSARRSTPTGRARSSGARSPTSTAGRSATRSRCAARSTRGPGRSRCAASTTARTAPSTRRRCSSTGTSSTRRSSRARRAAATRSACSSSQLDDPDRAAEVSADDRRAPSRTRSPRR